MPHRHLYHLVPFVAAALIATFLIAIMSIAVAAQEPGSEAEAFIRSQLRSLNQLSARAAGQQPGAMSIDELRGSAAAVVDDAIVIPLLTRRIFGDYAEDSLEDGEKWFDDARWRILLKSHRQRLQGALRGKLIADLLALAGDLSELELVSWQPESATEGTAVVASSRREFRCHLRRIEGMWTLADASLAGRLLSRHYRSSVRDIIDREYSLEVVEARLENLPYIAIEDFSATPQGMLPLGWGWRDRHDDDEKLYQVQKDDGRSYLAAQDRGASVILMRAAHWNPRSHPIMTWCWRADSLPPGGDERYDNTNDSAAGIYVIFSQNWLLRIPKHNKYVWSTTLPQGTVGRRNKIARPYFFVVESGSESQGKWTFEVIDLQATFNRVYGGKPKKRTVGLGILTDANSTDSFAEAFYADIRVWPRQALEQGLITDYCNCSSGSDTFASDPDAGCTPLPSTPKTVAGSAK